MVLTIIYPETQVTFPFFTIDEIDEWIDVCSACTAPYDRCTLNHWQILYQYKQNHTKYQQNVLRQSESGI